MSYKNNSESGDETLHDPRIAGFGMRLKSIIGEESVRAFARKCGFSDSMLRSYLKGETYPTLDRLDAIAHAGDVDPAWLLVGQDQVREPPGKYAVQPTDLDKLERIVTLLEQGIEMRQAQLSTHKKAHIITLAWRDEKNTGAPVAMETILQFIDLAK